MKLILASRSPRRKMLLEKLGLDFDVVPSNAEEIEDEKNIEALVVKNAELKAESVAKTNKNSIIIGADTVVSVKNKILGKPKNLDNAYDMIKMLSGKKHTSHTGLCVIDSANNKKYTEYSKTEIKLRDLDEEEIQEHLKNGDPLSKSSGYNITDDFAIRAIEWICGSYTNSIGIPVEKLIPILKKIKINSNDR